MVTQTFNPVPQMESMVEAYELEGQLLLKLFVLKKFRNNGLAKITQPVKAHATKSDSRSHRAEAELTVTLGPGPDTSHSKCTRLFFFFF